MDRVYFLSRYLIHATPLGHEVLEVTPDPSGRGLMRKIGETAIIAKAEETGW